MSPHPEPTPHQIMLMAWLDGELDNAERSRFERILAEDPELAAEAAEQKALLDSTRSLNHIEPTEAEIRRFWTAFYNRAEWQVAWVLLSIGMIGLLGEGIYLLLSAPALTWVIKAATLSALAGGALLIWNTARLRMRTSRFDRYRGVMR